MVREFLQRGQQGWAPSDTWSLDHYLAGVMGASLVHLAEHSHGWPGPESEWESEAAWTKELRERARVLSAYSTDWEGQVEVEPSLHRLATIWGHLWD
jgi:hypothetical protein